MLRKLIVITIVIAILAFAGLPAITTALYRLGVIPIARSIRAEYLTGTALAVILALLILLPSFQRVAVPRRADRYPVCDQPLRHRGRYCPTCGSRLAA